MVLSFIYSSKHIVQLHFEQAEQTFEDWRHHRAGGLVCYGHQYGDGGNTSRPKFYTTDVLSPRVCDRQDWLYNCNQYRRKMQYFLINIHLEKKFKMAAAVHQPSTGSCAAAGPGDRERRGCQRCFWILSVSALALPGLWGDAQTNSGKWQCCVWCRF